MANLTQLFKSGPRGPPAVSGGLSVMREANVRQTA